MTTAMTPMEVLVQEEQDSEVQWYDLPVGQVFSCQEFQHFGVKLGQDQFMLIPFDGCLKYFSHYEFTGIKPVPSRLIIG